MVCVDCGRTLPLGASFCSYCGTRQPPGSPQPESGREKKQRLRAQVAGRHQVTDRPLPPRWGEATVKAPPDQTQGNRGAWLTWGTFAWAFFGVMYLLNTVALVYTEQSGADILIGAPITAALETLVVVAVLRLGSWVFSQLR